jgi:hypothetical protein
MGRERGREGKNLMKSGRSTSFSHLACLLLQREALINEAAETEEMT